MRLAKEHMSFKALCVLDEMAERARRAPLSAPSASLRFALAFLWAVDRNGDRKVYDDFWRAAYRHGTDYLSTTDRGEALHRAFVDIAIRAGHEPSVALKNAMWKARGAPMKEPVPPDVRRG
jgi:hypothetical protein